MNNLDLVCSQRLPSGRDVIAILVSTRPQLDSRGATYKLIINRIVYHLNQRK